MALIDIPLPRLLDESGAEIRRIYPLRASVTVNKTPLSTATIDLPAGETLPPRAWVEMYTVLGSAGIFRVYSPQTAYGDQICNVQLDHGVVEIGDYIIRTAVESDMSARNAFTTIFSNYRGTLWRLGTVEATETVSVDIDGESVLEAILATMDSLPDYYLDLDQSSRPWTLNVRHMPTTVSAEGRLDRNVESATITPDGSSQVTRLYIEGLPNGYIESDNIGTVGTIERTLYIGGDDLTPESVAKLQREAQRYIERHKIPLQNISISGYDFSAITGESLDQIGICRLYRLALADYNTVISANITSYSFDDVYDNPYSVSITLDEEEAGITASLQHLKNESSGGGGGGKQKKKEEKKFKQYETRFEKTDERMALIATESEWDEAAQEGRVTYFTEMERTARYVTESAYQELPYDDWKTQTLKADPTADVSEEAYQRWIAANPYAIYNYEYIDATQSRHIISKTGINELGENETVLSRITQEADRVESAVYASQSQVYSTIGQTASNIRVELADTEQNLYNYINLTASGIRQQITNAGNRTIVNDTDPRGDTYTPKEGDIWIESVHDGTWDGADGFDWEHDEDYDWTQVQGAKVWTWKNNQWQLVADRQQLVTYSDFVNTADLLISKKIAELANEEGQVEVYRSLIEQSAENIRAEVYGATSDIYSYIHQTASSVSIAAGQRPTTVVQNSHTSGTPTSINGRGLKENDIWIDTADQTSWDEALNFNWNDDVEYNWNELRSDKIYVYRNGAWHLALDGTVLTEDTDLKVESDRISLLARNIDTLNGYARENFAQLQVRANEIYAEVLDKTNNLGSRITQTATQIRSEVHASESSVYSEIIQTASNILLHVENEISDMGATLEVTAEEIRSSVWSAQSSVYSSITQTASQIRSEVRDTKLDLQSSITQTASQIRSEVNAAKSSLYSSITQTASQIRSEVASTTSNLRSLIKQNADNIVLKVSKGDVGTQLAVDVGNVSITNGNLVVDGYVTAAELNAETAKFNNLVSGSTQAAKIWAVDIKANNVEIGSGTSGTLKYHGTNVTTRNALSVDGTKTIQVLGLGLDDTDSGLDALSGAFNGCNINANDGQIKFTFYKLGGGYVERNFNIADTAYYINAMSARRVDNIIAARLTTPTYNASTGNISADFRLTAQNGTGDDVTSLGSYDKTLSMSGAAAYSAGQDSMGVALDTDNNTVIVTESATKSMSVTAAAGISYSAVSHQYTAAAGAKVNGTTLASATKVSGTEAYEAGIADAEVYITQNDEWASGDWYVYPGDDYSFYPATFVGGDFKINYNRGIRIIAQGGGGTTINVQEARHASGTFAYNMNIKVKVNGTVYTVQSQPLSPNDWVNY